MVATIGECRCGGWGGIRTHEELAPLAVFKTAAFNRSATHPTAEASQSYAERSGHAPANWQRRNYHAAPTAAKAAVGRGRTHRLQSSAQEAERAAAWSPLYRR